MKKLLTLALFCSCIAVSAQDVKKNRYTALFAKADRAFCKEHEAEITALKKEVYKQLLKSSARKDGVKATESLKKVTGPPKTAG